MPELNLQLSILDQSPVHGSETGPEALQRTILLAQCAEKWGYRRFWVAEHHNSERYMGSSPEVLLSHLVAHTSRIRLGSGGVMLQHYSPYKVAENFNLLACLAPGRVDLGIGRGPGGLPRSTAALQAEFAHEKQPFRNRLEELQDLLGNQLQPGNPRYGLQPKPLPPQPAGLFLLGTTTSSAEMAASLRIPYVFALFLNSDNAVMHDAVQTYRRLFETTAKATPQVILALPIIVADTDAEAAALASDIKVVRIKLAGGRTFTVGSLQAAEEFGRQAQEDLTVEVLESNVVHGSPSTVQSQLAEIQARHGVTEIIAVTAVKNFAQRLRSFQLLGQLVGHQPVIPGI